MKGESMEDKDYYNPTLLNKKFLRMYLTLMIVTKEDL